MIGHRMTVGTGPRSLDMSKRFAISSGSEFGHQRRLFTRLDLGMVLLQRTDLCLRQFARTASDCDRHLLVERLYERFECEPLHVSEDIKLERTWEISDGRQEMQYAAYFVGDPILWDCSPTPVDDFLPTDCDFNDWFLPPGETLERPQGEIYRDRLILVSSKEIREDDLKPIRGLIAHQCALVEQSNRGLLEQLEMLARACQSLH